MPEKSRSGIENFGRTKEGKRVMRTGPAGLSAAWEMRIRRLEPVGAEGVGWEGARVKTRRGGPREEKIQARMVGGGV